MRLVSKERNAVVKRRFAHRIALLFPSTYEASISSLGYQLIYYYLNSFEDVFAERVLSSDKELRSIETGTPLKKFDLILATAHYELDYIEIVKALVRAGIPPLSEERGSLPLILGGPSITAWPFPMSRIADAEFLGEFEASGEEFVDALQHLDSGKKDFIDALGSVRGFWLPNSERREIVRVRDLDSSFHPILQIQNEEVEPVWGRSLMVEVSRGCSEGCLFCLEAAVAGVRRERSFDALTRIIERGLEANMLSKVTFFSLSFFSSSLGDRLLRFLSERGIEGSIPSVRAETITEERAELIKNIGQRTVAIAPETGREELRFSIGKRMRDEEIFRAASALFKKGISVKLYYMFGLPNETKEDLDAIVQQVREIKKLSEGKAKLKISANPFIPKPLTAMWKHDMLPLRDLKEREKYLRNSLRGIAEVEVYEPKLARKQYEINIKREDASRMIIEEALRKMD